eukprot:413257_1
MEFERFLESKGLKNYATEIINSNYNEHEIRESMTNTINEQRKKNVKDKNLLLLIDRTYSNDNDLIYITSYDNNQILLNELEENTYFIGMT